MLQGPHGPFFDKFGRLLPASGAAVWRCAFNAGDEFFWSDKAGLLRHQAGVAEWPDALARIIGERGITDIVLHAAARDAAQRLGPRLHVFEAGYLVLDQL